MAFVWCLLIDHNRVPLGGLFKVEPGYDVQTLRGVVKQGNAPFLDRVASPQLVVLRRTEPAIPFDGNRKSLLGYVDEFYSGAFDELGSTTNIANLNICNKEVLLLQLPSALLTVPKGGALSLVICYVGPNRANLPTFIPQDAAPFDQLRKCFVTLAEWKWTKADLEKNSILPSGLTLPQHVTQYRERLYKALPVGSVG